MFGGWAPGAAKLRFDAIARTLGIPSASPELLLLLGAACMAFFGILLGTDALRASLRRRAARRRLAERVREAAERAALDPEEADLLGRTLAEEPIWRAGRALESGRAFGALLDRAVARLRARGADPREALRLFSSIRRKLGLDRAAARVPIATTRELSPGIGFEVSAAGDGGRFHERATLLAIDEERLILRLEEEARRLPSGELLLRGGVAIRPGEVLSFSFWREGDAEYRFRESVVETRARAKGILVLAHPTSIERRQKREFVRVAIDAEFAYRKIPRHLFARVVGAEDRLPSGSLRRARLLDLSGGGLRLRAPEPFEFHDVIAIEPPFLPALRVLEPIYARRTRRGALPDGSYAFAFTGIGEPLRDRIIGLVYRIERARARGDPPGRATAILGGAIDAAR